MQNQKEYSFLREKRYNTTSTECNNISIPTTEAQVNKIKLQIARNQIKHSFLPYP